MKKNIFLIGFLAFLALSACKEESDPIDQGAVERGKKLVVDCTACHNFSSRAELVGPHLIKVFGRQVASVRGYDYSQALIAQDFEWNKEKLVEFIMDPTSVYQGTKMAFGGITESEASDIVEYIRSISN